MRYIGLSAYISSEWDVTYAVLGNSNLSLNEIGFATATTSTNNHIEQQTCVAASDIVMKRGGQRYEINELADRCGDMQTEWCGKHEYTWSKVGKARLLRKILGFSVNRRSSGTSPQFPFPLTPRPILDS